MSLIDDSSGDLDKTVIKEISASEDDNKVYIVCSGGDPVVDNVTKIRVLRHSDKGTQSSTLKSMTIIIRLW